VSTINTFNILFVLLSLVLSGCGLGTTLQTPSLPVPTSATHPVAATPSAEQDAVTASVQSAVESFLSNDFSAAQKSMRLQPLEKQNPKTQRMFADYSLHLNKRLLLEAKDAGLKIHTPDISVANVRAAETGGLLADVSIRAAVGLAPLTLTVNATRVSGIWLVDFAPLMLALMDALDDQ